MISNTIDDIFALAEQIKLHQVESELIRFAGINEFSLSFVKLYRKLKAEQPYHINVIDLLWANENAHSRILLHLLKQNVNGKYEIFESFIHFLFPKFNHSIEKPEFSSEKYRIDLLVKEKGKYAIIFENKIHNAVIQKNQIARYIEKMKGLGYAEKQIYVLYLPPNDSNKPNNCCWRIEQSCCKECDRVNIHHNCTEGKTYFSAFENRYLHLTFRDDILRWLKRDILPNCRIKDTYLQSTIVQYIDHLEGLFDIRNTNKKMNMELQDYIKQTLKFETKPEHNLILVKNKIDDLSKVINQLNSLKVKTEKECWSYWLDKLRFDFPNYKLIDYANADNYPKVGVQLNVKGFILSVCIEQDKNIYYGIGCHDTGGSILKDVSDMVTPILNELGSFKKSGLWYGWKHTSFENGYERLKTLVKMIEASIMI